MIDTSLNQILELFNERSVTLFYVSIGMEPFHVSIGMEPFHAYRNCCPAELQLINRILLKDGFRLIEVGEPAETGIQFLDVIVKAWRQRDFTTVIRLSHYIQLVVASDDHRVRIIR